MRWFARNGRDLPWRRTRDPYAVVVSEFMLHQTQVPTVIPYYGRWLHRFPSFTALAAASENDVLHAWQGLGYYARARNLHATAKAIRIRHRGKFPREIDAMRELPGIGRYTANAIATFAFDEAVPVVEANTARVLARLFNSHAPIDSDRGKHMLWKHAASLVPPGSARIHNSALMDLGALVCLPRRPKCHLCPVKKFCGAENPEALPIKKSRPQIRQLTENHAFIFRLGQILLEQSSARWCGMWTLPRNKGLGSPESFRGREAITSSVARPIHISIFPFTHHRITLQIFSNRTRKITRRNQRWFPLDELDSIPIPSPHRRAIVDLVSVKRATGKRRPQS
jgi:A/G-specific adenine glycosylase